MMRRPPQGSGSTGDRVAGMVGETVPAISYVWQTPARRPRAQPGPLPGEPGGGGRLSATDRARLERIVGRAHEVMVKVTGRTKSLDHLQSHLAYITRNGELAAETDQGGRLSGREGLKDLQARWSDDVALDGRRRADATLSINMILSMPPGTDAIKVRDAARAFASCTFEGRHDYALVLHQDDAHPHVHLTVRSFGYDGRRLNPRKGDLAEWRERFAAELRLRGIEAEATPRRTRGQVRKADRGPLRAMRARGVTPRVDQAARAGIVQEARGEGATRRPWEGRALDRRERVRTCYDAAAQELARSSEPADQALAERIQTFLATMPAPVLRDQALRQDLMRYARAAADRAERGIQPRAAADRERPGPERG